MFRLPATCSESLQALNSARKGLPGLLTLSFAIALFPVATLLFLLLIFDVAIPGRSGATLTGLFFLYIAVLAVFFVLGTLRRRMLAHIGDIIQSHMMPRIDEATAYLAQASHSGSDGAQAARDLDAIQFFFRSRTAALWLDMAAAPIAIITMLFVHPWLALWLLIALAAMAGLLWQSTVRMEQPLRDAVGMTTRRQVISESGRTHHDVLRALGMKTQARRVWTIVNQSLAQIWQKMDNSHFWLGTGARMLMYASLAIIITMGAWFTVTDRASSAVTIAAGILAWLTLEPWVLTIESLPQSLAARQGWARLDTLLATVAPDTQTLNLPDPKTKLECQTAAVTAPAVRRPILHGITFELSAGDILGVIGPAGCGKSTLARALAGVWPLMAGKIRLDGAALDQWDSERLAAHIGYLPQTIGLIDGTVAENIARFEPDADPEKVIDAARKAHAHDLIVRLPEGYNTRVGPDGGKLSTSQAQRIALARALYSDPFLVVLDEPTAHLDTPGMQAFADSVNAARDRGAIVIIAGNANNFINLANQVLILRDGTMSEFGEREAVRQRISEKRKQVKIGIVKGVQNDDTAAKNDDEDENVSRRTPAEASHED